MVTWGGLTWKWLNPPNWLNQHTPPHRNSSPTLYVSYVRRVLLIDKVIWTLKEQTYCVCVCVYVRVTKETVCGGKPPYWARSVSQQVSWQVKDAAGSHTLSVQGRQKIWNMKNNINCRQWLMDQQRSKQKLISHLSHWDTMRKPKKSCSSL